MNLYKINRRVGGGGVQKSALKLSSPNLTPYIGKSCASNLKKLCIRPTKSVHPTYKSCSASDLRKLCIRPTKELYIRPTKVVHPTYVKVVHPTYESCASDLRKCASDLHVQLEHRSLWWQLHTDNICSSCVGRINKIECASDLQLS